MDNYQHEIQNRLTSSQILTELIRDCWTFESWSEHPEGDVYFVVKVACGVQARGRYKTEAPTLDKAIREVYNIIQARWGKNE